MMSKLVAKSFYRYADRFHGLPESQQAHSAAQAAKRVADGDKAGHKVSKRDRVFAMFAK
jgi:hypothetical protein